MLNKIISTALSGITPYLLGAIFIILTGFGLYFWWSQSKIENQARDLLAYEITIQTQQQALIQLGADVKMIKDINKELTNVERDSASNAATLADKLSSLEEFAKAKPGLAEERVNAAAVARLRCFELATGAQPKKNETNSVCPHLLK